MLLRLDTTEVLLRVLLSTTTYARCPSCRRHRRRCRCIPSHHRPLRRRRHRQLCCPESPNRFGDPRTEMGINTSPYQNGDPRIGLGIVQSPTRRWILLATIVEKEFVDFGGGTNCCDIFLASIFLVYVEPKKFPHARWENSPVQSLLRSNLGWLLCPPPHPLEAIETQDPIALSIFIFLLLYLTPVNDG